MGLGISTLENSKQSKNWLRQFLPGWWNGRHSRLKICRALPLVRVRLPLPAQGGSYDGAANAAEEVRTTLPAVAPKERRRVDNNIARRRSSIGRASHS